MFFRRKKKVEPAKLNNNEHSNLFSNNPQQINPENQQNLNSPEQNLFGSNIIPSVSNQNSAQAMSITKPEKAPDKDIVSEKSKLFEPFRAESSSSPSAEELKKTIIDNEKEIGKIASDMSSITDSDYSVHDEDSHADAVKNDYAVDDSLYNYDDAESFDETSSPEISEPKDKFVSIAAYKQATKELNVIRKILSESSALLDDVKSNVQEEAKNFSDLKSKLEDVERKIINLDQSLFGED